MTAEEFFYIFKAQIPSNYKVEDYYNNTKFTGDISKIIQKIISDKYDGFNKEYYRIDYTGWTNKKPDREEAKGFKFYLWDFNIAVEHENSSKDWMDEVVKLSNIYCPLRVVIGYVPYNKKQEERLKIVANLLKDSNSYDNMKNGEFLIILGNSSIYKKKERMFGYRGYLFNPQKEIFEEIQ